MHVPVLAEAALHWLRIKPDGTYVDCTAGFGGHAEMICRQLAGGRFVALDRDPDAVERVGVRLAPFAFARVLNADFGSLARVLAECGIDHADGVLLDAGLSSVQLDDASRGFSFQQEGPLDMRMDRTRAISAEDYLASVSDEELARVLREYGDVRPAQRIAKAIRARATSGSMRTTFDLRDAVRDALPFVHGTPDEVRTVFQAIRIAVNDEYKQLEAGIRAGVDALGPEGRIVVISFHSGEDRIVKNILRDESRLQRTLTPDGRTAGVRPPRLRLLTDKPETATAREIMDNPRSHSAKLRAAERCGSNEANP